MDGQTPYHHNDEDDEEKEKDCNDDHDNGDDFTRWQPKLASNTNINSFGIITKQGVSEK